MTEEKTMTPQEAGSIISDSLAIVKNLVAQDVRDWLAFGAVVLSLLLFVCFPLRRTLVRLGRGVGMLVARLVKGKESELCALLRDMLRDSETQVVFQGDGDRVVKSGTLVVTLRHLDPPLDKRAAYDTFSPGGSTIKMDNMTLVTPGQLAEAERKALLAEAKEAVARQEFRDRMVVRLMLGERAKEHLSRMQGRRGHWPKDKADVRA
jgi:hypothetical protein